MKKITLDLSQIRVESFELSDSSLGVATVYGQSFITESPVCVSQLCSEQTCGLGGCADTVGCLPTYGNTPTCATDQNGTCSATNCNSFQTCTE